VRVCESSQKISKELGSESVPEKRGERGARIRAAEQNSKALKRKMGVGEGRRILWGGQEAEVSAISTSFE